MMRFDWIPSSIASRVVRGMQSIAIRRSCACRLFRLTIAPIECPPDWGMYRAGVVASTLVPATERKFAHARRAARRLLGTRADRRGPAAVGHRGGSLGLPLRLGGRGVRVRHRDRPGLAGGEHEDDEDRVGDL